MSLEELCNQLKEYPEVMELRPPLAETSIEQFCIANNIELPPPLKELLRHFNGGELFIPGTKVYGVKTSSEYPDIKLVNSKEKRGAFSIPRTYLIFARLNYGDFVCINLNDPYDVIQWDHELDEQYCCWHCLEEWLEETIQNYLAYEGDE